MKICIWSDGMWCHADQVEQYTHRSDDYEKVDAPEVCDECIDAWVSERVSFKIH